MRETEDTANQTVLVVQIHSSLPPGISLVAADGFAEWFMDIRVLDANPIYINQTFRLKFKFTDAYPIGTPKAPPPTPPCNKY